MKYRNVSFIGKLQEAVEIVEAALEDKEFKELPEEDQIKLEQLSSYLFVMTNKIYQRMVKK